MDPQDSQNVDVTRESAAGEGGSRRVGPYRLIQRIGEGGMGEVYLAHQLEPVHRKVALKIVKPGLDSTRVLARFEAERQALALMDHPAIAKVFDAGTTLEGRPYIAMEFVPGEPITAFCETHKLSVRDRIELFIQLCDGVQHAHQKGIIHRDLKPSNVLVTITDERPVPRIIDFGIAKAMVQPLTERSVFTEFGVLIGTPEYMSPEQAELSPLDVDTRSDVYSLGLLLYEILVGDLPFDREALRQAPFDEVRRVIREVEAPRPSTRVTRHAGAAAVAARRQTHPTRLASLLRGDLDWIVRKALEKDRTRRYATANALAMDLRRHLAHEPVLAGPPSTAYRVGKFARRHRVGVAAAVAAAVMVMAFAAAMSVQASRIAAERDRANEQAAIATQVSDFLKGLFLVSDPSESRGNTLTAREILTRGADRIDTDLADQPVVQARMQATIGTVYTGLGMYPDAQVLLEAALRTQQRVLGPDVLETLATANALANALWYQRKYAEAEPLYVDVAARRARLLGPDHPDTLRASFDLASLYLMNGQFREYETLGSDTLARQRRTLGSSHPDTLSSMNNLHNFYYQQERYREAAAIGREVYETRRRTLGPDHPSTLTSMHNLGTTLWRLEGGAQEGEALMLGVIALRSKVLGDDHPATAASISQMATSLRAQRRYDEAALLALRAQDVLEQRLGVTHANTQRNVQLLVSIYEESGDPEKAAEWRTKLLPR